MVCCGIVPAMVPAQPPRDDSPGLFDGLDDAQVLERAKAALRRVQATPLASAERSNQWASYEAAKAELDVRFYLRILWKLHEGG